MKFINVWVFEALKDKAERPKVRHFAAISPLGDMAESDWGSEAFCFFTSHLFSLGNFVLKLAGKYLITR